MPKLKVSLGIGIADCRQEDEIEIPDSEWEECTTKEEKEELGQGYWEDWSNNYIDGFWEVIE